MNQAIKYLLHFLFVALSCSSKTDKLKGHWHSIEQAGHEKYRTLDINDSISKMNKFCLDGINYRPLPIYDEEGNIILPVVEPDYTKNYEIKQDTLIIGDGLRYLKVLSGTCRESDLFCNLIVNIDLKPSPENAKSTDDLPPTDFSYINIGKLKKEYKGKYQDNDSTFIQVNDVFIEYQHVEEFASREEEMHQYYSNPKDNFAIAINADQNASQIVIDSVILRLKNSKCLDAVYLTSFNEKLNQVEYNKL